MESTKLLLLVASELSRFLGTCSSRKNIQIFLRLFLRGKITVLLYFLDHKPRHMYHKVHLGDNTVVWIEFTEVMVVVADQSRKIARPLDLL